MIYNLILFIYFKINVMPILRCVEMHCLRVESRAVAQWLRAQVIVQIGENS